MLPLKNTTIQELAEKRDKYRVKIRKEHLAGMFQKKRQLLEDPPELDCTTHELVQTYISLKDSDDSNRLELLYNLVKVRSAYDRDYSVWLDCGLIAHLIDTLTDDDCDFECRSVTALLLSNIINKFRGNQATRQQKLIKIVLQHQLPQQIVSCLDAKQISQDYFNYMENFIYLCSNMLADSYQFRTPMIRSGIVTVCLKMYRESESEKSDDLVCWMAANIVSDPLYPQGQPPGYEDVCNVLPIFNHYVGNQNLAKICLESLHDMWNQNMVVKIDTIMGYIGHSDIQLSIASMKLLSKMMLKDTSIYDRMNILMSRIPLTSIEYGEVCRLSTQMVRNTGRDTLLNHPLWTAICQYAMKEELLTSSLINIILLHKEVISNMAMPQLESLMRETSVKWVIEHGINMEDTEVILMTLDLLDCIVRAYTVEHIDRRVREIAGQYEDKFMVMLQHPQQEVRSLSAGLLEMIQNNINPVQ